MTDKELDAIEKRVDALRCEDCSGHGENDLDGPGYAPGDTEWCGSCDGYGTVDSPSLSVAVMADVAALVAEVRRAREELSTTLADWNKLVAAVGAPTHGTAIGHAVALVAEVRRLTRLRPCDEADEAPVLWWRYGEPPYAGSFVDDDFPGFEYFAGWTPLPSSDVPNTETCNLVVTGALKYTPRRNSP